MVQLRARHVSRTATIHLTAPESRVFPLFEPIDEKLWAEGWEPEMLHPESGAAQQGAVFLTRHPGEPVTIWTIARYEPDKHQISYVRVTPESRLAWVDIQCVGNEDGTTSATISYTFTALSELGNQFIEQFTEAHYREWMTSWEAAINHFLRHGHTLPHH